ncbi:MAG: AMP-binding protein, partial [Phycisphaerae bacterium]
SAVYHFNPLDARVVGKLVEKFRTTILAATPTFLRSYLKRCTAEEFGSLNLIIVGAEKLPEDLRLACLDKFGVSPSEGYGTTELSPVVSINLPESRAPKERAGQVGTRYGTVGRAITGTAAAVFHPETGEKLGTNQEGMLKIKGPNVMLGYLNHPEKTAELIQDGWYTTGDIAIIDDDGFIQITGRQSRFSKIGGEMVPHIRIENELAKIID